MAIENLESKADLERFVLELLEKLPLNRIQALSGKIAELETRLQKGGL